MSCQPSFSFTSPGSMLTAWGARSFPRAPSSVSPLAFVSQRPRSPAPLHSLLQQTSTKLLPFFRIGRFLRRFWGPVLRSDLSQCQAVRLYRGNHPRS